MPIQALKTLTARRLRILWIVLGALLLVSVTPLWLYHRQVLRLSEEKLQDTEQVQQNETTRSLASETLQFQQGVRDQLVTQRQVLALTGWIHDVDDPAHAPELTRLLRAIRRERSGHSVRHRRQQAGQGPVRRKLQRGPGPIRGRGAQARLPGEFPGLRFDERTVRVGQGESPGAGDVRAVAGGRPVQRDVRSRRIDRPAAGAAARGERPPSHGFHRGRARPTSSPIPTRANLFRAATSRRYRRL